MAIPKFLEDVKIISKLGDFPRSDDNLSPEQFRAKFDEGAQLIKDFLNNDLIPNINAIVDVQALLNSVIDKTLTLQDKAAEAKAVGDELKKKLSLSGGTMTGAIDMGSNAIENIPYPTENAHPATKGYVDNHKIDRAHLADDAIYSPIIVVSGNVSLSDNHLGRTINFTDTTQAVSHVFTITKENSEALPIGFESAILFAMGESLKIVFSGGVGVGISGHGWEVNPTITIPDKYSMVAIKKINSSNNWLVTGNVEVV